MDAVLLTLLPYVPACLPCHPQLGCWVRVEELIPCTAITWQLPYCTGSSGEVPKSQHWQHCPIS